MLSVKKTYVILSGRLGLEQSCGIRASLVEIVDSRRSSNTKQNFVMASGFTLHLAASRSEALKLVSSTGDSRKLAYRNHWTR